MEVTPTLIRLHPFRQRDCLLRKTQGRFTWTDL